MSGRSGYRKTRRKVHNRTAPQLMPDWCLTFLLPKSLAFAVSPDSPTGVIGVTVERPGPRVKVTGKDRDWVFRQAGEFLGKIAGGMEIVCTATLERGEDMPVSGSAPTPERHRATRELVYVPGASVVFLHPLKRALVVPVRRVGG